MLKFFLTALVMRMAYYRGIMCVEVGGPVCIMTRTMGTSPLQYQHSAASYMVAQESSLTRGLKFSEIQT